MGAGLVSFVLGKPFIMKTEDDIFLRKPGSEMAVRGITLYLTRKSVPENRRGI